MSVIELTHSVPDVEHALDCLSGEGLTLGVGTITDADQIQDAADAGASFVVSFTHPRGFVEQARRFGLTPIPGAFTPSEFAVGVAADAPAIKLFPARLTTTRYLHDLFVILPRLRVLVSGGVSTARGDIGAWLRAGAAAVCLGGDLGTARRLGAQKVERLASRALTQAQQVAEEVGS
jgi:2-dehydro-3-deoxyphosphogluconate aldolase/(4S)-4-hydroxy-2-oxoglutarate aldolase